MRKTRDETCSPRAAVGESPTTTGRGAARQTEAGMINFDKFKAGIEQIGATVSVSLHFATQEEAEAYYDWLLSKILDAGEVSVRFDAKNLRQIDAS